MRSLAHAGDEGTDDGAAARDAHNDPGDQEVDVHEVSGRVLVQAAGSGSIALDSLSPGSSVLICGNDITGGEVSSGTESPDETADVPGEATEGNTAATKATEAGSSGGVDGTADCAEETGGDGEKGLDETPKEPGDEFAVDIGDIGSTSESLFGGLEGWAAVNVSVPCLSVGVGESVLAKESNEGDSASTAGECANAGDCSTNASSAGDLLLEAVHLLYCLCLVFNYNGYVSHSPN